MERKGIVRKSSSPRVSPLHMVLKDNNEWRPAGDYKALNVITVKHSYAIPFLTYFINQIDDKVIFAKLDLKSAFHLVPVKAEHIGKTAICKPFRTFKYL